MILLLFTIIIELISKFYLMASHAGHATLRSSDIVTYVCLYRAKKGVSGPASASKAATLSFGVCLHLIAFFYYF